VTVAVPVLCCAQIKHITPQEAARHVYKSDLLPDEKIALVDVAINLTEHQKKFLPLAGLPDTPIMAVKILQLFCNNKSKDEQSGVCV
jgi:hypothetical protein